MGNVGMFLPNLYWHDQNLSSLRISREGGRVILGTSMRDCIGSSGDPVPHSQAMLSNLGARASGCTRRMCG